MKKIITTIVLLVLSFSLNAQNTFPTNDNVGIGTTSPNTALHIKKNQSGWLQEIAGTSPNIGEFVGLKLLSGFAGETSKWVGISAISESQYSNQTGLGLYTGQQERFRITSSGNVGIGTSNPRYKLSVAGGHFNVEKNGDYYGFWVENKLRTDNPKMNLGSWYNHRGGISYNSSSHYLTFDTQRGANVYSNTLVLKDGNVGVGTTNPTEKIDLEGGDNDTWFKMHVNGGGHNIGFKMIGGNIDEWKMYYSDINNSFKIGEDGTDYFTIRSGGNVGIGTINPDMKLTVKGKIHAEEVKIDLNVPAPDYVFKEDYKLRTIKEVEEFIKENSHLPEIPSAKEFKENGVLQAEMDMSLLKKIEELTLYTIAQEKKINELSQNTNTQQEKIKKLEEENQQLKSLSDRLAEIEVLLNSKK